MGTARHRWSHEGYGRALLFSCHFLKDGRRRNVLVLATHSSLPLMWNFCPKLHFQRQVGIPAKKTLPPHPSKPVGDFLESPGNRWAYLAFDVPLWEGSIQGTRLFFLDCSLDQSAYPWSGSFPSHHPTSKIRYCAQLSEVERADSVHLRGRIS